MINKSDFKIAKQIIKNAYFIGKLPNNDKAWFNEQDLYTITDQKNKIISILPHNPMFSCYASTYEYFLTNATEINTTNKKNRVPRNSNISSETIGVADLINAILHSYLSNSENDENFLFYIYHWSNIVHAVETVVNQNQNLTKINQGDLPFPQVVKQNINTIEESCESKKAHFKTLKINQQEHETNTILNCIIEGYNAFKNSSEHLNDPTWLHEIRAMADVRQNIHNYLEFIFSNFKLKPDEALLKQVKNFDLEVIDSVKNLSRTINYNFVDNYDNTHWWYHLHELDKLSEEDLKTI